MTLQGKKGLVVGIANAQSIAWGCARAFQDAGASLAVTYLNEKAQPFVQPLAEQIGPSLILPLDVRDDAQMSAVLDDLLQLARDRSPARETACIDCVGAYATFLASNPAHLVTGSIAYVDVGFNIMGV